MFHRLYWEDIDPTLIAQDPKNPEWQLFAVWENPDKSVQIYFTTDPILVYDLAHKNRERIIAQSEIRTKFTGEQVLNMLGHTNPKSRFYVIGERI